MPRPTEILRGAPLTGVDHHVWLAGVLVDPESISFEIKDPAGSVAVDEDGVAITGRAPIKLETGVYHAGNTVLPADAATGLYSAIWSVVKVPSGPVILSTEAFEVVEAFAHDPETEGQSRDDVAETENIRKLRAKIKDTNPDSTKRAFFNSELQELLDDALAKHTEGRRDEAAATSDDVAMALLLAVADAMLALGTDRSKFFRWIDGNEQVDKTKATDQLAALSKAAVAQYTQLRKLRQKDEELGVSPKAPARELAQFTPRKARRTR